jgi:hypothetical protein
MTTAPLTPQAITSTKEVVDLWENRVGKQGPGVRGCGQGHRRRRQRGPVVGARATGVMHYIDACLPTTEGDAHTHTENREPIRSTASQEPTGGSLREVDRYLVVMPVS